MILFAVNVSIHAPAGGATKIINHIFILRYFSIAKGKSILTIGSLKATICFMKITERCIREYITKDKKDPFGDWFESLKDAKTKATIDVRIGRLRLGNFGDAKGVGQGICELRMHFGPGYRIYYGLEGNAVILLLCGGDKGSRKRDIKKAVALWNEYKEGV